jgi:hypothetical protein
MQASGQARDDSTILPPRLEQLNEIGIALSQERIIDRLLEAILLAAKTITRMPKAERSTGCHRRRGLLRFEIIGTIQLGIAMGGNDRQPIPFGQDPAEQRGRQPNNVDGRRIRGYPATRRSTSLTPTPRRASTFPARKFDQPYRLPLDLLSDRADEEPRERDHRRSAVDQRHWTRHGQNRGAFLVPTSAGRIAGLPGCHRIDQPAAHHAAGSSCSNRSSASSTRRSTRSRPTPAAIASAFRC